MTPRHPIGFYKCPNSLVEASSLRFSITRPTKQSEVPTNAGSLHPHKSEDRKIIVHNSETLDNEY